MKLAAQIQKILVIDWTSLPAEIKEVTKEWCGFHNDCYLSYQSEFEPGTRRESWAKSLTRKQLESYWQDQTKTNGFQGDLTAFIDQYGLEVDAWMIEQIEKGKLSVAGVDKILFKIGW